MRPHVTDQPNFWVQATPVYGYLRTLRQWPGAPGPPCLSTNVRPLHTMNNSVTVENGLAGHFKQDTGRSRFGIDWVIRITGGRGGVVIVRTYFSSDTPQEAEKQALADKAVLFVQRKLEQGWLPWAGVLEYEDEAA